MVIETVIEIKEKKPASSRVSTGQGRRKLSVVEDIPFYRQSSITVKAALSRGFAVEAPIEE